MIEKCSQDRDWLQKVLWYGLWNLDRRMSENVKKYIEDCVDALAEDLRNALKRAKKTNYIGGACGVMVIVAGIGYGDMSSNSGLIAFHIALIPLGKVWIQLFSLQLWVHSRAD